MLVKWTFKDRFLAGALLLGKKNEAVKASSPSSTMRALARVIGDLEVSFPSMTWCERVAMEAT